MQRPMPWPACLENIVTGRKLEFASGRELLDAIAGELRASADERSDDARATYRCPNDPRSEWMNTKQDFYQVAWWERNLEEIDREVSPASRTSTRSWPA